MIYDLIIIGADAAGLTAGIYAGRKKLKTLILTKKLGGQSLLTAHTENYPGFSSIAGVELISKMKEQVEKFGVPIEEGVEATGILKEGNYFTINAEKNSYAAKTIIVASGRRAKELKVPGEEKFKGKGVSVCTICDAPFFEGQDVAVVGGGYSALESAYDLLNYAKKIYVLHRGEEFRGDKITYDKLLADIRIEFLRNILVKEIQGDKFVESLVYEDSKTGELKDIKVGGVFINIGQIPNSEFVRGFLVLNKNGEIVIGLEDNKTSVEGVFAAGDVTDIKYKQSIIAAAEGAKALLSACDYLKEHSL